MIDVCWHNAPDGRRFKISTLRAPSGDGDQGQFAVAPALPRTDNPADDLRVFRSKSEALEFIDGREEKQ